MNLLKKLKNRCVLIFAMCGVFRKLGEKVTDKFKHVERHSIKFFSGLFLFISFMISSSFSFADSGIVIVKEVSKEPVVLLWILLFFLILLAIFLFRRVFQKVEHLEGSGDVSRLRVSERSGENAEAGKNSLDKGRGANEDRSRQDMENKRSVRKVKRDETKKRKFKQQREERAKSRRLNYVAEHLKEDERQIVEILKRKGGMCMQGTLLTIADFSKSKLSEILSELESRRIISKRKKGRSNVISLT